MYQEWIANHHRLEALLQEMKTVSRKAGRDLLSELDDAEKRSARSRRQRRSDSSD